MSFDSITFPGTAERIHEAREWASEILGAAYGAGVALLVLSELATNAVRHSASGQPGGTFTLHLGIFTDGWQVCIADSGGTDVPRVHAGGRGLAIVAALSSKWGVHGDHRARNVWADIPMPVTIDLTGNRRLMCHELSHPADSRPSGASPVDAGRAGDPSQQPE